MGIRFNADEVLEMAERIESKGAEFYRRAADLRLGANAAGEAAMLRDLAAAEDRHQAIFAAMRRELTPAMREETAADPYLEATLYLDAMADEHGGEGSADATRSLTGRESMADILNTAIALERKSILFYVGIKDMVPPRLGREKIEAIITEEKAHLSSLAADLRRLR